jgi:two-component system, sporulation sensor kinase E
MTDRQTANQVNTPVPIRFVSSPGDLPADANRRYDLTQVQAILPGLLDSLTDAIVVLDSGRRVVAANRRYIELFGRRDFDVAGMLCDACLACPEADGHMVRCPACEAMDSGESRQVLRSVPDPDGTPRRWEATFSPVRGDDGRVTHVVEVWRDISERTRLEAQLSHSERLAALGTLAAGVGHEINNPLAAVLAGIESLQRSLGRGENDRARLGEVLELIERETRRCRETTDKLMLLAQPYAVAPNWVNLNQAVSDTLSLLAFEANKFKVKVETALDPGLPPIWAKDTAMRSVCMNLMMNAVQAMRETGGVLKATTRLIGDRVELDVSDTGPGIAPGILDRIWNPFFTTKPMGQGTGLGLSVTQRIVARHGGEIRVESEPGRGARFVVTLPVAGPGGEGV